MYHSFHTGSLQFSCSFPREKASFLSSIFKDTGCIQKLHDIHIKILCSRLSKTQETAGHGWTLRYYAEQNKSDGGRQMPYDFTHIQIYNKQNRTQNNEQTKQNKVIDTKNIVVVTRGEGDGRRMK